MSVGHFFRPTTTVSILRTTPSDLVDEYGDPKDNEEVAASGIPCSLLMSKKIRNRDSEQHLPVDNRLTKTDVFVARIRTRHEVQIHNDRLLDERTGEIYLIEEVDTPVNPYGEASTRMILRKNY